MRTCRSRSAPPTWRCRTSREPPTSSRSCASVGSSVTTGTSRARGAPACCRARRAADLPLRMPILHAVVLGLVQGLSEFLPISSSGHLLLVPWLFGWDDFADAGTEKAFDVALHIGTLVAVIGYFRRDLVTYMREGLRLVVSRERPSTVEGRLAWLLVLSAVPAAAVGAAFENVIDETLGTPTLIAASLIVFGLALAWADRHAGHRPINDYTSRDALTVG